MLENVGRIGGAAVVALGLMTAVTDSSALPIRYTADLLLTTTVLGMGGVGFNDINTDLIGQVLNHRYATGYNLVPVQWPAQLSPFNGTLTLDQSVKVGVANLDAAIRDPANTGPQIVVTVSGTTLVADEEMQFLAKDPTAPAKDQLSFVLLGDANRGVFKGFQGIKLPTFDVIPVVPVTKYDVTVVAGEYDGIANWPDRWWNLLADANALAGMGLLQQILPQEIVDQFHLNDLGSVHSDSIRYTDLAQVPAKDITTTTNALGGVTTTYLVRTADLPLLRPLKSLGVPQDVINVLEKVVKPIIDSAYVRNDPPCALPQWLRPSAPTTAARSATAARAAGGTPTVPIAALRASLRSMAGPAVRRTSHRRDTSTRPQLAVAQVKSRSAAA